MIKTNDGFDIYNFSTDVVNEAIDNLYNRQEYMEEYEPDYYDSYVDCKEDATYSWDDVNQEIADILNSSNELKNSSNIDFIINSYDNVYIDDVKEAHNYNRLTDFDIAYYLMFDECRITAEDTYNIVERY